HAGDYRSWLSGAVCLHSDADGGGELAANSVLDGTRGGTFWRQLAHDPARHCRADGKARADGHMDHRLCFLLARRRDHDGGLSGGLRYPARPHTHLNGQRCAKPHFRFMRHFDSGHATGAFSGGSLASPSWAIGMSMIAFRSVCKDYNGCRVIDSLSLQIEAKERVVLFGPSGCGKSTILHLIAGFVTPDSGEILIDDEVIATAKKNLREPGQRGLGMVFQDLALWPH